MLKAVLRIRMFLDLLDPDPLVRGTDQDPFIFKQNSKKKLDSYCFEKLCKCTSKSNKQ
jgi:hypothetical protein